MKKIPLFSLTLLVLFVLLAAKFDIQLFDPLVAHYTGVILQQGRGGLAPFHLHQSGRLASHVS
jgi:hypothetical protein